MANQSPGVKAPAGSCSPHCNLHPYRETLCRSHPDCLMLAVRQLQDPSSDPAELENQVSESVVRSLEGGHCRTRSLRDVSGRAVMEEVELHCRTLTFESVLTRDAADATPVAPGDP